MFLDTLEFQVEKKLFRENLISAKDERTEKWFMERLFPVHEVGLVVRVCNGSSQRPPKA